MFIETERLVLRQWRSTDYEPFALINADFRVMEYFPKLLTLEETMVCIERIVKHINDHGFGLFACELKSTGKFLGFVGLSIPTFEAPFTPCVEIGWRLAYQYWGNGYATEAAKAVLKFGFETVRLNEILSWTVPKNMKSRKIMEKIGMKQDETAGFNHPRIALDNPLSFHILYRISK
jgi:RimJ/RimL family protein N-acetyltransferase